MLFYLCNFLTVRTVKLHLFPPTFVFTVLPKCLYHCTLTCWPRDVACPWRGFQDNVLIRVVRLYFIAEAFMSLKKKPERFFQ